MLVVKCVDPKIRISSARFANGDEQFINFVEVFKFIVIFSVDFGFVSTGRQRVQYIDN